MTTGQVDAADTRRREIAKIQIARKDLGMAEEVYRKLLWTLGRAKSSSELDHSGRRRVLDHMRACGWKPKAGKPHPGKPRNIDTPDRGPLLRKVEALLADARREWAYADGVAKAMFGVDRVAFCHAGQLHKLVAALEIDKRRRADRSTEGNTLK